MDKLNTFLQRMQPVIDGMKEGADKQKLQALVESQDTIERADVHPKERALARRRLMQIDAKAKVRKKAP